MAVDRERAARIKELKKKNPQLTWAKIADEAGVKERSAIKWQTTGALKTENAAALARLFGVDFDYIWWGPRPDTPELFVDRRANQKPAGPVAVERLQGEVADRIDRIENKVDALLEQRDALLDVIAEQSRILELISQLVGPDALRQRAEEAVKESIERARAGLAEAQPPGSRPTPQGRRAKA